MRIQKIIMLLVGKTTLGWLEFESLVTQGFLRRCGDQFWCLRGWQARDHSSGDNEQIGGLASCAFGFPVWYTVGAYWYQSCLFPETFEELGVRLINNSCRWIVEMNVIHHGWQFWISMGLDADMEVCMIFMKQEAMRQDDWIFLEDKLSNIFLVKELL